MINKENFYRIIREKGLFKKLSGAQVVAMDFIIDTFERQKLTDRRWLAYMFATIFHETAREMLPIEEYGKGRGYPYGRKIKRSGFVYTNPDKIYYGRGFVQLTWYENYELMGRLLGIDLLRQPELALKLYVATQILFEGMLRGSSSFGDFTGKCLEQYINTDICDYVNARRIINGMDKADLIAGYARKFETALGL